MDLKINTYAIERIVNEWKNQRFPWIVMDTPLSSSDAFALSIQYFFLGSVIHYRLYGTMEDGTQRCYFNQNAEGSIAFWRTLKTNWGALYNHRLEFSTFEHIFKGLVFLPERYRDWMETIRILRQLYSGEVKTFLESCQWDTASILERMDNEFPAFRSIHDDYSERSYLFLYLTQGKFASANLFNKTNLILPYLDQIMLASLIQNSVIELPSKIDRFYETDIHSLRMIARKAMDEILSRWSEVADRRVLPADINSPLRNQGLLSIWRNQVPLMFS